MRALPNAAAAARGGGRRMDLCEQASVCATHPSASCFPSVNNTGIEFKRTSVTSAVNNARIVFKLSDHNQHLDIDMAQ
jgi:hypothetical protein